MSEKAPFDASGMQVTMEHLIQCQGLDLNTAAACFVLYAVGLVYHHCGVERAQAILDKAQVELHKEARKSTHGPKNKSN